MSTDTVFIIGIFLLIIFFGGDPDLMDGVIGVAQCAD